MVSAVVVGPSTLVLALGFFLKPSSSLSVGTHGGGEGVEPGGPGGMNGDPADDAAATTDEYMDWIGTGIRSEVGLEDEGWEDDIVVEGREEDARLVADGSSGLFT